MSEEFKEVCRLTLTECYEYGFNNGFLWGVFIGVTIIFLLLIFLKKI